VTYQTDEGVEDAGTFTLAKEDHTIANLIRKQLLLDPNNLFAGYIVPHPLQHRVQIKIHTKPGNNSKPHTSMKLALQDLLIETRRMKKVFNDALNAKKPTQVGDEDEMEFDLEDDDE
jgi:DNA-directed RNA polymerase II subunit RPB11